MENTATLKKRIAQDGIRMTAEWVDSNPHMSDMPDGSSLWRCTFRKGRKQMTTFFSTEPAHSWEPEAEEVLDCLLSDTSTVENARDFEDFASELGYDTDSHNAERIYKLCQRQATKLKTFLNSHFEDYLWHTEQL